MPTGLLFLVVAILLLGLPAYVRLSPAGRKRFVRAVPDLASLVVIVLLLRSTPGFALLAIAAWAVFLLVRRSERPRVQSEGLGDGAPHVDRDMTRQKALEVLGLEEGATEDAIVQAYRELIKKLHPDRGGSAHLASQVNRARDVLLSNR